MLVTGAASGLGAALTEAFLARGDEVLATDLTPPSSDTARALWPGCGWTSAPRRTGPPRSPGCEEHWGSLDVLVNNAGVAGGGRVDLCTMDEWAWLTDINLFGVVRGVRTFAPLLKQQGSGRIVNVASLAGLVHPPGMGAYNAVKAAVVAFSETLAHELAPYGVGCSAVCPSYFRTNLTASMRGSDPDVAAKVAAMVEQSPISAEDIAAAVLRGHRPGGRADHPGRSGAGGVPAEEGRPARLRHRDAQDRGADEGALGWRLTPTRQDPSARRTPSTRPSSRPGSASTPPTRRGSTAPPTCGSSRAARPT